MNDDSPTATAAAGGEDHWPSFDIAPKAYEEAVAAIARSMNLDLVGWEVRHLDPVIARSLLRLDIVPVHGFTDHQTARLNCGPSGALVIA
jgi:hypothetical protein